MTAFDPDAFTRESQDGWNEAAPHYQRIAEDYFRPLTEAFIDFAGVAPGMTLLDVACGPGTASCAAAARTGPAGKVMGVDLSWQMLKLAAERGAAAGPMEWREMNAETLDFPDETFDLVVCQLGLMLFARPEKALSEMKRVLKRGGAVACLVQGNAERMLFTSLVIKTMARHAPELKRPGAPTLYAFGPAGVLDTALAAAGLERVISLRKDGAFVFPSAEEYWNTMTRGAGRTGAMLATLPAATQEAIRADVLKEARALQADGGVAIPYEVVMAKGMKP